MLKTAITRVLIILLFLSVSTAFAGQATLKEFKPGSYQQMLDSRTNQPFMLVVWSITCSSCLKDMALLKRIHQDNPKLDIVLLATDDLTTAPQIQKIVGDNQLTDLESWVFADENTQKLQYEIDPKWFGELPRTYFFDKEHQRQGISGVLDEAAYNNRISKILP